ncbi:hypothetical protein B0T20DRAFT_487846 [Sordaria brevicollis]|uniref:Uncharacterized protein n=1 Tax=Sordaria brevicollis TaxID=83679 RepID=A0AAE0P2U5_SORBR|nr:hypothetical protein B0T20DRAFT_487846 [Sordaria brevicollis]
MSNKGIISRRYHGTTGDDITDVLAPELSDWAFRLVFRAASRRLALGQERWNRVSGKSPPRMVAGVIVVAVTRLSNNIVNVVVVTASQLYEFLDNTCFLPWPSKVSDFPNQTNPEATPHTTHNRSARSIKVNRTDCVLSKGLAKRNQTSENLPLRPVPYFIFAWENSTNVQTFGRSAAGSAVVVFFARGPPLTRDEVGSVG